MGARPVGLPLEAEGRATAPAAEAEANEPEPRRGARSSRGNVPTTTNRAGNVHLLEGAGREPTHRTIHFALGAEQHPSTQLWQVWILRTGTDMHVISAYREGEAADATIAEIQRVAALGDLFDEGEDVGTLDLLHEAGDGKPQPFSPETMHLMCRTIEAAVWQQEQE